MGIPRSSRVLVFAGATGEIAHNLAQDTQLDYSDVSEKMVQEASRKYAGKGTRNFLQQDAVMHPNRRQYDYLVSLEPLPLADRLPIVFLRSMAYAKGIHILGSILDPDEYRLVQKAHAALKRTYSACGLISPHLAEIYGTAETIRDLEVPWTGPYAREGKPLTLQTIQTNPTARRRAWLDLALISMLQNKRKVNLESILKKLKKRKFSSDETEVQAGLERLNRLAEAMAQHVTECRVTREKTA